MRCAVLAAALLAGGCASLRAPEFSVAQMQARADRMIVVAVDNAAAAPTPRPGSTLRGYDWLPRYAASEAAQKALAGIEADYHLREVHAWPIAPLALHCAVLEIPPQVSRDALLAQLAHDARVQLAQPLQDFHTLAGLSAEYNDPYVDLQRGFAEIGAAQAQRWSRGAGVRVAVIDTGADSAHPDLAGRVALARDFVDGDQPRFRSDRHGTAVAGVIAAVANNRQGIVGVAPEVRLLLYKACWQEAAAAPAQCNSFTLAQAIAAALADGAQILNLSLTGPDDALLGRLVAKALESGVLVVGALPRDGSLNGFPTAVRGVIAVGDEDTAGRGLLRAPGREILTLAPGGHYDFASGSSLAAAHVSGTLALLRSQFPQLNANVAAALLHSTAVESQGLELVNACAALAALRGGSGCEAPTQLATPAASLPQTR